MNKIIFRLLSACGVFVLMLGSSFSAGASSAYGTSQAVTALPAFPGAEGFGANTIGGRGGAIFEVTNLSDAGAGSLRACVEASGPRTCVFRTGGLIVLQTALRIANPYITIAGQTAPGGGITLKKASGGDVFSTQTHDVVIRYLTSRPGPGGENHANQIAKNGIELYNIIIDHNSLSWGVDLNIETWYRVRDATIQWSLISEALNNSTHSKGAHSKGIMIGGYQGSESSGKGSENISVLNNLMAHNAERNPLMQLCGIAQVINNTTYNPQWTFSHQQLNCPLGESYVNWINNYHKKGPSSTSNSDLKIIPADSGAWSPGKVFVKGNIGPSRSNDTLPETNWVSSAPAGVIVSSPAPAPAVFSTTALEAYNSVSADGGVGNSRGLNCDGSWYNRRDSIDVRVINEVKTGTGKIIDDPSQVGGWIVPAAGVPCTDSDHDGMPDVWERGHGFNPNVSDGSADKDGDGYSNIEEYFNGTNPLVSVPPTIYPTVIGITSAALSGIAINVNFTVIFSKNVTGVDTSDFSLTGSGVSGAAVVGVSGSGSVYTVTVNTGTGNGTIRLNIKDDDTIQDVDHNPLGGSGLGNGDFSGEIYTINKNIETYIGGGLVGAYSLGPSQSASDSFAVDGGPVEISSNNGAKIVASLYQWRRRPGTTPWTGITQSMALPVEQITNQYVMPRYDYSSPNSLLNQVLIANVDTVTRDITVKIGANVMGTYTLAPSASQYLRYDGVVGGPVVVSSVAGARIVASLYELVRDPSLSGWIGQSEMMGLPGSQLSDKYLIPMYFGASSPNTLKPYLYIANVDAMPTTVEVKIAGVSRGTYPMNPNTSIAKSYLLDGGPVEIGSNNGAKIVASLYQWRRRPGTIPWTGITQSMALPVEQITNQYVMPRYDYTSPSTLLNQVLIANVDTVTRDVTVKIGANVMGTYTLAPSASQYLRYDGVGGGPLVVSSVTGARVVASLYELVRDPSKSGWISQSEMIGLPGSQLSDKYLIPMYFGASSPNTLKPYLYIGVP